MDLSCLLKRKSKVLQVNVILSGLNMKRNYSRMKRTNLAYFGVSIMHYQSNFSRMPVDKKRRISYLDIASFV